MKENCGSYPVYPTYPGQPPMFTPYMNDTGIINQLNNLEQRVTDLEKMFGNASYSQTSYSQANYQI